MKQTTCMPTTHTDFPMNNEFKTFFSCLLDQSDFQYVINGTLQFIQKNSFSMTNYPESNFYSRTIIERGNGGSEAMIARWKKKTMTKKHGHPAYELYYLLQGKLFVENFELHKGNIVAIDSHEIQPGKHFSIHGIQGRFDNGIHRVTALEESLSIHVYSDDPMKGVCFD